MSESIHSLTRAVASGETEAFARFYDAWFDRVLAEAKRCSGRDEQFALDIVQDVMMKVIRSMPAVESEPACRRWLNRAVRSTTIDHLRRETRRRKRERAAAPSETIEPVSPDDRADRIAWLRTELRRLDGEASLLLALKHKVGGTLEQIGAATGLSPGAVDGRIRRFTARLRRSAEEASHD